MNQRPSSPRRSRVPDESVRFRRRYRHQRFAQSVSRTTGSRSFRRPARKFGSEYERRIEADIIRRLSGCGRYRRGRCRHAQTSFTRLTSTISSSSAAVFLPRETDSHRLCERSSMRICARAFSVNSAPRLSRSTTHLTAAISTRTVARFISSIFRQRCSRKRPISASRLTATPTALCSSMRTATSSTATRRYGSWPVISRAMASSRIRPSSQP